MADRVVKYVLRGDISQFAASMRAAGASTKKLADDLTATDRAATKSRQNMSTLGQSAGRMGLAVSAGLALAAKAAIDWEQAWAGVTKTVDGSDAQMAELEQGLRGLAKTLPATHSEIAGVAEAAGQLGVAREDILSFTKTMIDLGVTTNLSADEAATAIAQFMNVMQTAPADVDNLGSALVALGNDGASTERDIIMMAQNIAGAGKIVGASESDILALSNALASVGIEAEAGGSAVSKILIDMSTAVQTNSESLKTWASVSGQTTAEFAANFSQDPVAAFDAFTQGLGRINAEGGDVFSLLESLGQSDIRVTRAMLGMANSGDLLSKSLETGSEAWRSNTALAAEAEKRYATTGSQIKVAWNQIKDAAIEAGDVLLPVIAKVASGVSDIADAFGSLPGPVQTGVVALGTLAAGGLLVTSALAKIIVSVGTTRTALDGLAISGTRAGVAMTAIGRGAAGLAAFWAGAAIGDKIGERNAKGIDKMAASLEHLGKTGKVTGDLAGLFGDDLHGKAVRFGKDLGSIGDAVKSFAGYADDNSLTESLKFFGSFGQSAGITQQAEAIGDLDKAFAELSRNKPDAAIEAFAKLRDRVLETGGSTRDLENAFPTMVGLLRSASEAAGGTSDATKFLKGNLDDLAPVAGAAAEEAKAAAEALEALKQSTRDAAMSFFDFNANLDTSKVSLGAYIKDLEATAKAQADWAENVIKATARGLNPDFIKGLEEQGPEGAKRLAELADASEKEIARINAAFDNLQGTGAVLAEVMAKVPPTVLTQFKISGTEESVQKAVDLAHKYNLTPDEVKTVMEALDVASPKIAKVVTRMRQLDRIKAMPLISVTDAATGKIRQIQQYINGMHGKTVRIAVVGGAPGGITTNADGNLYVRGRAMAFAGGGTYENHVAQIGDGQVTRFWNEPETDGEAYIPFAMSKRKRSQQIAMETVSRLGGVAHFANGGTTGGSSGNDSPFDSRLLASALATATERAVTKSLSGATFHMAKDGSIRLKTMRG